ncbi:hypothetical protein PSTG_01344 [Puccinia striiformis f. sp. tritici PST-78]|uniref:Uncharacterized protein n=1 Tax=Puccinia striiformis f. sp. tritici PST-78 TaxID=1165861 RepID=A0A0L0W1W6_9BASI|nr:hypothetical protein PSTG_01344 [Puccinia striiformis f. sp. tritici PST-78]
MNPNSKSVSKVYIANNCILYTVGKVSQPSGPTQSPTNFGLGKEFMFKINSTATNDSMADSKAKKGPTPKDPELDLLQIEGSCRTNQFNSTLEHSSRNTQVGQHAQGLPKTTLDPRLYLNVKTPFSALIHSVQGSIKSHSALVILEGSHYERGSINYPCESTYLRLPATRAQLGAKLTSSVPVTVLVFLNHGQLTVLLQIKFKT